MTGTDIRLSDLPDLVKVKEVAKVLRVSEQTVYTMLREGQIPSMRAGRKYLIPRCRLVKMVESIGAEDGTE